MQHEKNNEPFVSVSGSNPRFVMLLQVCHLEFKYTTIKSKSASLSEYLPTPFTPLPLSLLEYTPSTTMCLIEMHLCMARWPGDLFSFSSTIKECDGGCVRADPSARQGYYPNIWDHKKHKPNEYEWKGVDENIMKKPASGKAPILDWSKGWMEPEDCKPCMDFRDAVRFGARLGPEQFLASYKGRASYQFVKSDLLPRHLLDEFWEENGDKGEMDMRVLHRDIPRPFFRWWDTCE